MSMQGRVLIVAGSDSGGGAGIQADIKTVTALRGFAMTAVTALTVQNTKGVFGVIGIEPAFIAGAMPVVVDPVMFAKGGHALLEPEAMKALRERLLPLASLVTPNIPEAEALTGMTIKGVEDMASVAAALAGMGATAVLLKGGHLTGDMLSDILYVDGEIYRWDDARIDTPHTHGTGCTMASAIATGLAQGMSMRDSVARSRAYVRTAILQAPGYGQGHGPLDHGHTVGKFTY